jgi:hypothetical protein
MAEVERENKMTYTIAQFAGNDGLTIQFVDSGNVRTVSLSKAVDLLNAGKATLVGTPSDSMLITYSVGENAGQTCSVSTQVALAEIAAGRAAAA